MHPPLPSLRTAIPACGGCGWRAESERFQACVRELSTSETTTLKCVRITELQNFVSRTRTTLTAAHASPRPMTSPDTHGQGRTKPNGPRDVNQLKVLRPAAIRQRSQQVFRPRLRPPTPPHTDVLATLRTRCSTPPRAPRAPSAAGVGVRASVHASIVRMLRCAARSCLCMP